MKNFKTILTLSEEDLRSGNKKKIQLADYLEVRIDLISEEFLNKNLSSVLMKLAKSIVFTYRKPKDSNQAMSVAHSIEAVYSLLEKFNSKQNYIDVEMDSESFLSGSDSTNKFSRIYSFHNFSGSISFQEMNKFISSVKSKRSKDLFKFAVSPKDVIELGEFLLSLKKTAKKHKVIGIAMGEAGIISRVFGDEFGSGFTYCCLNEPKAPGQVPIDLFYKLRS